MLMCPQCTWHLIIKQTLIPQDRVGAHCLPGDGDMPVQGLPLEQVISATMSDPFCIRHLRTGPDDFLWNIQSHDPYGLQDHSYEMHRIRLSHQVLFSYTQVCLEGAS